MGTTAEKLTYLNTTKQNLKTVINTTGAGLTDESTFRSYANVLNDKILGAINGDVDLFEEYPKVSDNGTDLLLNGVVEGKMAITPQGVSSQESTTGKNLLNSITDTTTRNGITFTKNSDGTYTLNGTSTSDIGFNIASDVPLDLNTSYILSGSPNTASNTTYRIMGACIRENDSTTYIADNDGSGVTIPSSKMIRVYINVKNGKTLNNVIFKPMIRLKSITDDTYEPYTDGPAPNPSYPFPVKSVTGENVLKISNSDNTETQTYPISLGNIELNSSPDGTIRDAIIGSSDVSYNLFDKNNTDNFLYTYIGQSTGKVAKKQPDNTNFRTIFIKCKPNTKYAIKKFVGHPLIYIGDSEEVPTYGTQLNNYIYGNYSETIYTTSSNANYLAIEITSNTDIDNGYTIQEIIDNFQITEGSEVKPYFPYGQVGMWYKREHIGKVVLDGSENWTVDSSGAPYTLNIPNSLITISNDELPNVLVDKFKRVTYNSNWNNYNSLVAPGTTLRPTILKFRYTDISSLDAWKTWLSENNVTVYYLKAQYTDTPITDTTLISQLNDIYNNAHSYNGTTNITTTYEDGNEQMYLDIEALKNVWEVTQ